MVTPRGLRPAGWVCALFAAALLAEAGTPAVPWVDSATQEMAGLLRSRAAAMDPTKTIFLLNDRLADILAEQLEWPRPTAERLDLRLKYATELLNAGRIQDSLDALEALRQDAEAHVPRIWGKRGPAVFLVQKAMAYMRMGEEQNCHETNNRDACLFPIQGQGVHRRREGSTRAIEVLSQALEDFPDDLRARWLLNVAYSTLGTYPDGVPRQFLIPPKAFASEYPLPRFDNVAKDVGLDIYGLSGGVIMDDFDNDGRLDLMVTSIGLEDQMRLFHNKGDGTFEDRTSRSGLTGEVGGLNLIQADYNNDGFLDALVLRGGWMGSEGKFPFSLLRNNGDGTFTDVTRAAGLLRLAPTQTAVWFDYDGDGWLDLFVGSESMPGEDNHCHLFHNNRDGTFTDVAKETGVDVVGWVKGVVSGDYNNDGRPDLYVSIYTGDNMLFRNDGPVADGGGHGWRFTNVAQEAGVMEPKGSFGAFFFDYDNDGWPDLYVAGYSWTTSGDVAADYLGLPTDADRGRLYHNKGDGTFEDVTKAAGLYKVIPTMGLNFGDLDNDGFLDIYLATGNPDLTTLVPNRMFRNADGRVFQDVTTAGNFGHLQKGHAVAFGDLDNDGDQDVYAVMGGAFTADKAYSALYENPGSANRWVSLELQGVTSNRSAIGARIKVTVETKGGRRLIQRTVGSGGSFGASPLRQEIGLGDAQRIASVEVHWPATGKTQTFDSLAPGHRYRIVEGAATAASVDRPSFKLAGTAASRAKTPVVGPGTEPVPR